MTITPQKNTKWTIISRGTATERVPQISGYPTYSLPFLADADAQWANYLLGDNPRALLISMYPAGHAKEWQVYPTDVTNPEHCQNFIGVLFDGFDYTTDLNVTVRLIGGVETKYVSNRNGAANTGTDDPDIIQHLKECGITRIKGAMYWDTTRKALSH